MSAHTIMSVSIPPNEALSSGIDLGSFSLVGFEIPAGWAGGAVLTFQAQSKIYSKAGTNPVAEDWVNCYDDAGTEISVTVAANRFVGLGTQTKQLAMSSVRFIRLRSGTNAAPVNQNLGGKEILLHLLEP